MPSFWKRFSPLFVRILLASFCGIYAALAFLYGEAKYQELKSSNDTNCTTESYSFNGCYKALIADFAQNWMLILIFIKGIISYFLLLIPFSLSNRFGFAIANKCDALKKSPTNFFLLFFAFWLLELSIVLFLFDACGLLMSLTNVVATWSDRNEERLKMVNERRPSSNMAYKSWLIDIFFRTAAADEEPTGAGTQRGAEESEGDEVRKCPGCSMLQAQVDKMATQIALLQAELAELRANAPTTSSTTNPAAAGASAIVQMSTTIGVGSGGELPTHGQITSSGKKTAGGIVGTFSTLLALLTRRVTVSLAGGSTSSKKRSSDSNSGTGDDGHIIAEGLMGAAADDEQGIKMDPATLRALFMGGPSTTKVETAGSSSNTDTTAAHQIQQTVIQVEAEVHAEEPGSSTTTSRRSSNSSNYDTANEKAAEDDDEEETAEDDEEEETTSNGAAAGNGTDDAEDIVQPEEKEEAEQAGHGHPTAESAGQKGEEEPPKKEEH